MQFDTAFEIVDVRSVHLRFRGSYWEGYRRDEVDAGSGRFEFRPGWQTVYAATVETAMTQVRLRDGAVGWGEPNIAIGPEVYCLIVDGLIAEMAKRRSFESPLELWDFLYDAQRGRGYHSGYWLDALAGVDIAVWDAIGRREGWPVSKMLGRPVRTEIPVYLSGLRRATVQERSALANEWIESGLRGAKIFLTGDLEAGLRELEALQEGAPDMEKWMVDTLWMLRGDNAARAKQAFGDLGATFLECPLQPEDLHGHRELWASPGAPIALGEHFRTSYQVQEWFGGPRALDVYQLDVGRTGISDGLRQLEMAERTGHAVTPHMGGGGPVFQAATFHFSALCEPTHLQEYQAGLAAETGATATSAWKYADGSVQLPQEPGLGVHVDEEALEEFIMANGSR